MTLVLTVIAGAALPAQAQPVDPIDALLDQRGQEPPEDADEPDLAGQPPAAPEPPPRLVAPATPSGLPSAPVPYAPPPRPQLTAPVHIEEVGKSPDAPPTLRDMAYDSRIKSSFASAQGFQGPLDGGWSLMADGADLYSLQLVDRADRLEGAWGDMRRKGALNASGLVDDVQRLGSELTLRFSPTPGGAPSIATLHSDAAGRWSGVLVENGQTRAVTLRRSGP
jgi:hypothetical protein